ncbi:MAG: helix-turn-helix domain-containing protein [Planctomycetes bacterium]|nr:helix-turn-helix domain-containing protein [Planctomycetota bacterium]
MQNKIGSPISLGKFLSVVQAAQRLGASPDAVRRMIDDGGLKAFHIGRGRKRKRLLIREEALIAWISERESELGRKG